MDTAALFAASFCYRQTKQAVEWTNPLVLSALGAAASLPFTALSQGSVGPDGKRKKHWIRNALLGGGALGAAGLAGNYLFGRDSGTPETGVMAETPIQQGADARSHVDVYNASKEQERKTMLDARKAKDLAILAPYKKLEGEFKATGWGTGPWQQIVQTPQQTATALAFEREARNRHIPTADEVSALQTSADRAETLARLVGGAKGWATPNVGGAYRTTKQLPAVAYRAATLGGRILTAPTAAAGRAAREGWDTVWGSPQPAKSAACKSAASRELARTP